MALNHSDTNLDKTEGDVGPLDIVIERLQEIFDEVKEEQIMYKVWIALSEAIELVEDIDEARIQGAPFAREIRLRIESIVGNIVEIAQIDEEYLEEMTIGQCNKAISDAAQEIQPQLNELETIKQQVIRENESEVGSNYSPLPPRSR